MTLKVGEAVMAALAAAHKVLESRGRVAETLLTKRKPLAQLKVCYSVIFAFFQHSLESQSTLTAS